MGGPGDSREIDLETGKVVVRHDQRVIEVLEKPLSWDDLVLGSILFVRMRGRSPTTSTP